MNPRILVAILLEEARVTWKASMEIIPKRSHRLVHTGKYRYRKFTRLLVQGRE